MNKLKTILSVLLLSAVALAGNFTTLTATITDPNGFAYVNGSYMVQFVPPSAAGATISLAGGPMPFTMYTGTLDANGALSVSLPDNGTILPSGSQWTFFICTANRTTCFSSTQTVTGTSQSLSTALSAASSVIYNHLPGSVNGNFFVNGTLSGNILQSNTANPSASGTERLATTDSIKIRNAANSGDVIVDADLGAAAGNLPADVLQQTGGGYQAPAFISPTANPAATGILRLANADAIAFRNNAQAADILLQKSGATAGSVPADSLDVSGFGGLKLPAAVISPTANQASAGLFRLAAGDLINWRNTANAGDIGFANQGAAASGTGNLADVLLYGSGSLGGLQAQAFVAGSAAPANSGRIRLSNTDGIAWRNNAAGADITLAKTGAASGAIPADALDASGFSLVKAGYVKPTSQTLQVVTSNYTTSATTLAGAGVVTGLGFTAPASVASNWSFHCDILYSQATAAAADLFGITTGGTAPTNLLVFGEVLTNQTGTQVDNNAIISSATSTTVVTATPSAFGAIGTTADMFQAHLWGTVEAPSNASPTTIGVAVASGNASDALTIYRGSACYWY